MGDAPEWAVHLPAGTHPGEVDLLGKESLPASWTRAWAANGDRVVLVAPGHAPVTGALLEEASRLVAARYAAAGLAAGDRILISLHNSVELVVAHVAALRLGLVVVPANTAYTGREIVRIIEEANPALAVVDDGARAGPLGAALGRLPVTGPGVDLPGGPDPPLDAARRDDPALIGFTSGTTGAPKGAVLTHGNLLATAEALRLAWRWSPEDRLLLCLPMFHGHGLCVGLHGTLNAGASAVLLPRFDVDGVLASARSRRASLFFGVPTMYRRLVASGRAGELRHLRLCVSGSAPLPAELHASIEASTSHAVLERYGMTETLMNISNPYDGERRAGRVGFALPGVEVQIEGARSHGEEGELLVRGPNVSRGYWGAGAATAGALDGEGWFRTGDVGSRDRDGYVAIVGRTKEVIITGGYNVHPREVEEVLAGHPSVQEVAVAGAPSSEWGEEVVAFVVAEGHLDERELISYASERMAPFKRPRRIRLVDALPRNALGKVIRNELA